MKKYRIIDNEEKLLKYLISAPRDEENKINFGINRYKKVPDLSAEEVVQTLELLQDRGYIDLYFYGSPSTETACYLKIREAGLTYFEDQRLDDETESNTRWKDFLSGLGVGILLLIIENVVRVLLK